MTSRNDTEWAAWPAVRRTAFDGHRDQSGETHVVGGGHRNPAGRATPPAAYFISVLELATGEKLGNDERVRAVAMLESQFGEGRPRTLKEAVRICAAAIDSSTLQRMARGAKA
ncbi:MULTISPECIES: hypothetical protein [unclassified Caballeronia]|uniref:hypothetical protein n=1 Tax=unclassified Caballeronia TaxID=2646786 RepID=UPI00285A632B|nr:MULTISPECIES: hypothetical protein [unclassified Caballeronia]MDR5739357.1 hypothetical protein [Caballeronia sp. LZ016]MDR5807846.1 hypothetical protein [Caballeronia sp. LZ019]